MKPTPYLRSVRRLPSGAFLVGENLIAQIVSAMSNLPLNFSIHSGVGVMRRMSAAGAQHSSRRTACPARSR
jgi:hypothetical protein